MNHRRFPTKKSLFNDVLYQFKVGKESSFPLHRLTTEKDGVKIYVKAVIGEKYNVKTYKVIEDINDLYSFRFPYKCCVKPTNSCRNFSKENGEGIPFKTLESWLKINYYKKTREKNYKNLQNKLIVEELLEERLGEGFYDYKVFCFHGRVNLIQVTVDRYINRSRVFYNKNWDKQDFTISVQLYKGQVPKPDNLNQMIQIAEKLSNPFGLVRIDLLSDGKNCLVGEITHCHGQAHEPFIPLNSEKKLLSFFFR